MNDMPNPLVERTRLRVMAHASADFAPFTFPHRPRPTDVSLTFVS